MVQNLPEEKGIESALQNEIIGTRVGGIWRPAGGVKVIISDRDYEKAKEIVDRFEDLQIEK
jgi:hypothetical protein